jgi:sec-independent protein translocase protein TatC
MPRRSEKDLFQESTMTFGQHLEELRACLFKSLFGLMFGVMVGLAVGQWVADVITKPLHDALDTFYKGQSLKQAEGVSNAPWIKKLMDEERVLPEVVYINPAEVATQLKKLYPQQFGSLPSLPKRAETETRRSDLVQMFLWHRLDDDDRTRPKSGGVSEAFSIYLKASMLVGVLLASPWIFYQLWSFVAPDCTSTRSVTSTSSFPSACCCSSPGRPWRSSSYSSRCYGSCSCSTAPWASTPFRGSTSGWASC